MTFFFTSPIYSVCQLKRLNLYIFPCSMQSQVARWLLEWVCPVGGVQPMTNSTQSCTLLPSSAKIHNCQFSKKMLPMVFLSFYFSECYEPMSLISYMYVNVQKCRCSKKLENTNPQIPKPRKKLNYSCSPDVCLAFCFHLTLYPTRII